MEIFDKFDRISYQNQQLTNILRRSKVIKSVLNKIDVYYDYVIKEGERADTIAHDYYGNSTYTWLVYAANNIYDPYYQWPLTSNQLFKFIEDKYGDPYQAQIDVHHYAHPEKNYTITPYTFNNISIEDQFGWRVVTVFEHENNLNEAKRNIKLISNQYLGMIDREISEMFT